MTSSFLVSGFWPASRIERLETCPCRPPWDTCPAVWTGVPWRLVITFMLFGTLSPERRVRLQVLSCLRPGRKTDTKNNVRGHKGEESERGTFFGGPGRGRPRLLLLRTAGRCAERHYCFRRSLRAGGPPPPPPRTRVASGGFRRSLRAGGSPAFAFGRKQEKVVGRRLNEGGFFKGWPCGCVLGRCLVAARCVGFWVCLGFIRNWFGFHQVSCGLGMRGFRVGKRVGV